VTAGPRLKSSAHAHLIITARREAWSGAEYTSASVISLGRFSFKYGKLEIRAKIPTGRGTWPALWLLGEKMKTIFPVEYRIDYVRVWQR
jgi:beta-glucanase (GH16 family)